MVFIFSTVLNICLCVNIYGFAMFYVVFGFVVYKFEFVSVRGSPGWCFGSVADSGKQV